MPEKRSALIVMLLAVAVLVAAWLATVIADPAPPTADQPEAVTTAVEWLVANNQNPDGGYGTDFSTGEPQSNIAATVDAVLAIGSAGIDPAVAHAGQNAGPIDYLAADPDALLTYTAVSGGATGKLIMALVAAGQDPRSFAGGDWVRTLQDQYDADSGAYSAEGGFNQALAMLGLATAGESIPDTAVSYLKRFQAADGSWDDGFGTLQNPDTTALAIMALLAAGVPAGDPAVAGAQAFLAAAQLPTGGWEYGPGLGENANSTAFAIQALIALGEDVATTSGPWSKDGASPRDVLLGYQSAGGAFQFAGADDFFATVQSIPAAAARPFPPRP